MPLGEKEETAEEKKKNMQHESVQEKEPEVVKQDSLNGKKDASSGLDNAQAESSVVERNVEKNEESSGSEFSDYEVIYDYVESTYAHGDAHDMTEVNGTAEVKGTAEVNGTEEIGTIEAEGTVEAEVVDEKRADAVPDTVDVDVEKQEIDEVVALADMDKDNILEILKLFLIVMQPLDNMLQKLRNCQVNRIGVRFQRTGEKRHLLKQLKRAI